MPNVNNEERVIGAILGALGEWNKYLIIGGGYALLIYRFYLTKEKGIFPATTLDVDTLIPRLPGKYKEELAAVLKRSGFTSRFKDMENPPTESYLKEIYGEEIELEFLTDARVRKEKKKNIKVAGVLAQPLSYIEMSLKNITEFTTKNGYKGKVVLPAAWVFHKALTFVRRKNLLKSQKDLYGIWYVLTQLGDLSQDAKTDLAKLTEVYPQWAKTMRRNFKSLDQWSIEEWIGLEMQDPAGLLTTQRFKKILSEIT